MTNICVFHDCYTPPTTIVVWGCYEHLDEFLVCPGHLQEWIQYHDNRSIRCTFCNEPSEAFMTKGIHLMQPGFTLKTHKMRP